MRIKTPHKLKGCSGLKQGIIETYWVPGLKPGRLWGEVFTLHSRGAQALPMLPIRAESWDISVPGCHCKGIAWGEGHLPTSLSPKLGTLSQNHVGGQPNPAMCPPCGRWEVLHDDGVPAPSDAQGHCFWLTYTCIYKAVKMVSKRLLAH